MSTLTCSASSSTLALLLNSDLSFSYSYVLPVLWKVLLCQNIPDVSFCLCVSLTHINMLVSLVPSLLSLLPCHPATPLAAAWFLFGSYVLLAFVVSKCCQVSPLSPGPLAVHSPCPPTVSLLLALSLVILSVILFLSYFYHPLTLLGFSSAVLSFTHSSYALFKDDVPQQSKGDTVKFINNTVVISSWHVSSVRHHTGFKTKTFEM